MRRALVWLNLYGCEVVRHKLKKQAKNAFLVFLGCFWAYVGQPHNLIGWATPMPFALINSTNPWLVKNIRNWLSWKMRFFWVGHFEFQNGRLKKTSFSSSTNSQYFFMKISWIGPWVCRIDGCEGHWCGSTYMVLRHPTYGLKQPKNTKNAFFACFWAYVRQPHNFLGQKLSKICLHNLQMAPM